MSEVAEAPAKPKARGRRPYSDILAENKALKAENDALRDGATPASDGSSGVFDLNAKTLVALAMIVGAMVRDPYLTDLSPEANAADEDPRATAVRSFSIGLQAFLTMVQEG